MHRFLVINRNSNSSVASGKARHVAAALMIVLSLATTVFSQEDGKVARTGAYTLVATLATILGDGEVGDFAAVLPKDESIEWEVVVPDTYDPNKPPGLLIYISPSDSGRIPRRWSRLTDSRNLIWVGANQSGNRVQVARRIMFALLATGLIGDRYELDTDRIYLSGFSGGARVSGLAAATYPGMFSGAIYIGGAEHWGKQEFPPNLAAMQNNRYAFVVGSEDANRRVALKVQSKYNAVGIDHTKVKIIQRLGHELPDVRHIIDALDFLDDRTD